jgi:hypothetical protein
MAAFMNEEAIVFPNVAELHATYPFCCAMRERRGEKEPAAPMAALVPANRAVLSIDTPKTKRP